MKIDRNWKLGCLYFVGAIGCLGLAPLFWDITGNGWGRVWSIGTLIICIGFIVLGIVKTWRDGEIDDYGLDNSFNLPGVKPWVIWVLIILGGLWWMISGSVKKSIGMYNKNIYYTNQLDKQMQTRKMFFDKMWKTYLLKHDICELNRETFLQTTQMIMEGRHDGEKVTWKWVQENQNIPYSEFQVFYEDLSKFVNSQREEYYKIEEGCMETVRSQKCMLDSFPNNIYNKFLGIPELEYNPGFTSTHTENVFKEGKEDL